MADMFMGRPLTTSSEVKGPDSIEFGTMDQYVLQTCNLPVEHSDSPEGPWERVEPGDPITKRYVRGIINKETAGKTAVLSPVSSEFDRTMRWHQEEMQKMWDFHNSEMDKMWKWHDKMMGDQKVHYDKMRNFDWWFMWYLFGAGIVIGVAIVSMFFVK